MGDVSEFCIPPSSFPKGYFFLAKNNVTSELNVLSDSGFSPFAGTPFLIKSTNHLAKNKTTVAKPISIDSFAKAERRHFLGQEAGVPITFSTWILHFYTSKELFMQLQPQRGVAFFVDFVLRKQIFEHLKRCSPATPNGLLSPPVCFFPSFSSMLPTLMI